MRPSLEISVVLEQPPLVVMEREWNFWEVLGRQNKVMQTPDHYLRAASLLGLLLRQVVVYMFHVDGRTNDFEPINNTAG